MHTHTHVHPKHIPSFFLSAGEFICLGTSNSVGFSGAFLSQRLVGSTAEERTAYHTFKAILQWPSSCKHFRDRWDL